MLKAANENPTEIKDSESTRMQTPKSLIYASISYSLASFAYTPLVLVILEIVFQGSSKGFSLSQRLRPE